jgi:hypothetical protein
MTVFSYFSFTRYFEYWRHFMFYQKGYFYRLLLSCVVLTVFSGCASTSPIPITTSIIRDKVGEEKIPKFQYFLSTTITLELEPEKVNEASTVSRDGQLITRSRTVRERITIPENTPGLVGQGQYEKMMGGKDYLLKVAFEKKDRNLVIRFAQYSDGDNIKYNIFYNDRENNIIRYGEHNYTVSFDGDELPYLAIREREIHDVISKSRRASGLRKGE